MHLFSRWTDDKRDLTHRVMKCITVAAAMIMSPTALTLPEDHLQSITIQSDSAERDEIKGTTTYAGRVLMQQGSMKIEATAIIIYSSEDKVTHLVATGSPAKYQQTPSQDQEAVIAQANTLEYLVSQETLKLIDNASLRQAGTSLSGTLIQYDVKKSLVKADSNDEQRVKMVIPPKSFSPAASELQPSDGTAQRPSPTNP